MKVSVLLLTHNEETNLPRCLDALAWCDDVVVVDSGSTDGTVAIAERAGARVIHRPFDDFARQRNFGLDRGDLRHDWVLHLDADEVVTPAFRHALDALRPSGEIDAYHVPSKLILLGTWLRHAGMYPVYQVRLGRRDGLRFKQVGHGQREDLAPERIAVFDEPYLHHSFSHGLSHWFVRHVRYARDEAALMLRMQSKRVGWRGLLSRDAVTRRRALKGVAAQAPLPVRPMLRFLYVYIVRRGFRDGPAGLTYAMMLAAYDGMTVILAQELKRAGETRSDALDTSA